MFFLFEDQHASKPIERANACFFVGSPAMKPWEASMLSAETIKEHDARQNAGAQRLLKALEGIRQNLLLVDGKWMRS